MQDTLLIIHILSAAAWIGGAFMFVFVGPRMAKQGGPAAGAWLTVAGDASMKYFMPASILLLLSGSLLVETGDSWSWSDVFVWAGALIIFVALGVGLFVNKPAIRAAQEAAAAGDMDGARAAGSRIKMGGSLIALLLIVAEILMVTRLGSG